VMTPRRSLYATTTIRVGRTGQEYPHGVLTRY
jgi:hypothetical protein